MTPTSQRRGMVRPISDLPASPGGAAVMEVDIGGAAYQAPALGGLPLFDQYTAFQAPFSTDFSDLKGHTPSTSGGVAISGGKAVFSSAGQIDYTTDDVLDLFSMDFVIEGWFKTTVATQFATLWERDTTQVNAVALLMNPVANDGKLLFYQSAVGTIVTSAVGGFNDGVRHHVAIVRLSTDFYLFVDGVPQAGAHYASLAAFAASAGGLRLGNSYTAGRAFIGEMDNWRMVRGIALYSVPFTVPTPPFPSA